MRPRAWVALVVAWSVVEWCPDPQLKDELRWRGQMIWERFLLSAGSR